MQKHYSTKKVSPSSHRFQLRLTWVLTSVALILVVFGVSLTFVLRSQTDTNSSISKSMSQQTDISTSTKDTRQLSGPTPVIKRGFSSNQADKGNNSSSSVSTASATPTLIPSTPQAAAQLGVFSLSSGGPLPFPETVLHPTNIARMTLNDTLISVYAGSMTRNPQVGILCVLRENLTSGQLNQQVYQAPHPEGALTILAVQNTTLKLADPKTQGSFDLSTNQFQW